jgi:hypothetical protein
MQPKTEKYEKALAEIKAIQAARHELANELLANIKSKIEIVDSLAASFTKSEPEFIYRFYHQSHKVFGYKETIRYSMQFFESVAPQSRPLNDWFRNIVDAGLSKEFNDSTNANWIDETRPLLEAFWHTKYFVNQMNSAAKSLDTAPDILPYDWAAVLYLYDLR